VLIQVVEEEVFVDLLLAMERGCKTGSGGKFIRFVKGSLAFFEILKSDTFHIHRMPVNLASSIMSVAVECRDDTL
jgi:beta-lactamase superfamily II metal-dependent hydrolase